MLDIPAAIEQRHEQMNGMGLAISRASWLVDARWERSPTLIPVIGGATVWAAARVNSVPVVEYPNWFGRFEQPPRSDGEAINVMWWSPHSPPAGAIEVHRDVGSVEVARNLAGGLRQIPGVKLPHGQPESPWFIVSLPGDAATVATKLSAAGFDGSQPLGDRFPEFPGGLRIQVAWGPRQNERFVQLVRIALGG